MMAESDVEMQARLDERVNALTKRVNAFGPTVREVIEQGIKLEQATQKLEELPDDLKEMIRDAEARLAGRIEKVAETCNSIHQEYRTEVGQRRQGRRTIFLAVLAAAATIIAAVIAATATILAHS